MSGVLQTDLGIIGSGLTGLCTALFASQAGLSPIVLGLPNSFAYMSGALDLLAVHPTESGTIVNEPWKAIRTLSQDIPFHPYAKVSESNLKSAFASILSALEQAHYPFRRFQDHNCEIITPVGTTKYTYAIPHTMWDGVDALKTRKPCLFIDFEGMKDHSAKQLLHGLKEPWPDAKTVRIPFPKAGHLPELSTEYMAGCLDSPEYRIALADTLAAHLQGFQAVAFPAMLGLHNSLEVLEDLKSRLGTLVFELPSPPVSVPGLRLKIALQHLLDAQGVRRFTKTVTQVQRDSDGSFLISAGSSENRIVLRASNIVLASGRFLGGGLAADRNRIRETLFDLPVAQPRDRARWHRDQLFDPRGHEVNRAGLEVDEHFRPLGNDETPVFSNLYAAGAILAHQDWMREKSGAGLAIATAHAAVNACAQHGRGGA